jgi:hypothetical protein
LKEFIVSIIQTLATAASLAAYKPIREAVYNGAQVIQGDLIRAGKTIGSGIDAVTSEVKSDVAKVKSVVETIGRTIDTFV